MMEVFSFYSTTNHGVLLCTRGSAATAQRGVPGLPCRLAEGAAPSGTPNCKGDTWEGKPSWAAALCTVLQPAAPG